VEYQIVPGDQLTARQCEDWKALLQLDAALDSPYLRPEFAQAVAAVRSNVCVGIFSKGGRAVGFLPFERTRFGLGRPVGGMLSGCQGLIAERGLEIDVAKLVCHFGLRVFDFDHLIDSQPAFEAFHMAREAAPYLDLSGGFETYCHTRRQAGSDRIPKLFSRERKLEREHGPLQFRFHSDCPKDFDVLREWKSAQFRDTGYADVFQYGWTNQLFQRLLESDADSLRAVMSVLAVGETPVAVSLALRSHSVLHGSLLAFDRQYAKYSPGSILLLRTAEAAAEHGIGRFDLGKGDQQYKRSLATGSHMLAEGAVTCQPLLKAARRGWFATRDWIRSSPLQRTAESSLRWIRPVRGWYSLR